MYWWIPRILPPRLTPAAPSHASSTLGACGGGGGGGGTLKPQSVWTPDDLNLTMNQFAGITSGVSTVGKFLVAPSPPPP